MKRNLALKYALLDKYGAQYLSIRDLGISEAKLSGIISKRIKPTQEEVKRITDALGMSAKKLGLSYCTNKRDSNV
jgi:hypothetical protein